MGNWTQEVHHRLFPIRGATATTDVVDRERHLVQVSLVPTFAGRGDGACMPEAARICAPETDGLVADVDAPLSEQLLDEKRSYCRTVRLMISRGKTVAF